jgi:hypothetical protein
MNKVKISDSQADNDVAIDYWAQDDFEDTVAAALIACFESKIKKNRGAQPSDRLTQERLQMVRNSMPYIPSPSRLFDMSGIDGDGPLTFDMKNDPLPVSGTMAWRVSTEDQQRPDDFGGYLLALHIRRANAIGKNWHKQTGGTLFEGTIVSAIADGIEGERFFFTVTTDGRVAACKVKLVNNRGYVPGSPVTVLASDSDFLRDREVYACMQLQAIADKRFCWTITANESIANVQIGCMREEVKSLLYARSLPMTSTGRKRPILHLVEAHKRRMKSGTDVDISTFLRGQQTVEIGGTVFTVNPPSKLRGEVSNASAAKFFRENIPA